MGQLPTCWIQVAHLPNTPMTFIEVQWQNNKRMSTFPRSPRLLKGGIVLVKLENTNIERIITLQYNPDTLTRSLQPKGTSGDGGTNAEAFRLTGPPIETFQLEAEVDATDQLEVADPIAIEEGIQPILAALETVIYPSISQLNNNNRLARMGIIEIAPMESLLTLFIWSKNRIVPVRFTDFSITEEAFDVNLNPIRAKINLSMRVLSIDDLGFDHQGSSLYMNYQKSKERLAAMYTSGSLNDLGINSIS